MEEQNVRLGEGVCGRRGGAASEQVARVTKERRQGKRGEWEREPVPRRTTTEECFQPLRGVRYLGTIPSRTCNSGGVRKGRVCDVVQAVFAYMDDVVNKEKGPGREADRCIHEDGVGRGRQMSPGDVGAVERALSACSMEEESIMAINRDPTQWMGLDREPTAQGPLLAHLPMRL